MLEVYQDLKGSCKLVGTQVDAGLRRGCIPRKVDPVGEGDRWFEGAPPFWPIHLF
jgi:hypothetical protein